MAITRRDATILAQRVLAQSDPQLVVDGWWGTFTNGVYATAEPAVKQAVDVILLAAGTNAELLLSATRTLTSAGDAAGDGWIPIEQAEALIDRAVQMDGGDAELMRRFLRVEAAKRTVNGTLMVNAKSVAPNGFYRGLYQMGVDAWAEAKKRVEDLDNYLSAFDAWQNTRAANAYIKVVQDQARAKGYKGVFTPEVLYALHNQGAGGFMSLMKDRQRTKNYRVQSAEARGLIDSALQQNGVRLA